VSTALYRRYRPETFEEVIGQEHVTRPLQMALANGRVNHAYLFSGPRGCGKTTSARILARCLNCAKGPAPTPCGECASCRDLATGGPGSLDVVEIDAASHNGVDDARDLRERAVYAPARDRYKVFILDEAHMVTPQGFNALLKLVEEPPAHVKFIFATTEPEKVIGTIRSRTHHYPFRLVPPEIMANYLGELCARENVPVGKGVLPLVVRAGGGSVRDSLSVLDQLMAGSGPDGIDYHTAVALLGYTPESLLGDIVDAFAAGDGAAVFRVIDRVVESGQDPRRFVEDLLERFRDLIVLATAPDQATAMLPDAPADRLERLVAQAQAYGMAELSRAADLLNVGLSEMTGATSPRLQLELMCARVLLPGGEKTRGALLSRLDRMERRIGMGAAGNVPGAATGVPGGAAAGVPGGAAVTGGSSMTGGTGSAQQAGRAQPAQQAAQSGPAQNGPVQSDQARPRGAQGGVAGPAPSHEGRHYDSLDDIADFAAMAQSFATEDLGGSAPAPAPEQGRPQEQGPAKTAQAPAGRAPGQQEAQPGRQPAQSRPQERAEQQPRQQPEPPRVDPSHPQGSAPTAAPAGRPAAPAAPAAEAAVPTASAAPAQAAAPGIPGGNEIDAIRRNWPNILDALGRRSRLARAILSSNAVPLAVASGTLQLGFNNEGSAHSFDRNGNDQRLAEAIFDELGMRVSVAVGQVGIDLDAQRAQASAGGQNTGSGAGQNRPRGGQEFGPGAGFAGRAGESAPGSAPTAGQHRPSQDEIDAVVGPRAMDREPVDHEKFWQTPPQDGPWAPASGPGTVDPSPAPAGRRDQRPQQPGGPQAPQREERQPGPHRAEPEGSDQEADPAGPASTPAGPGSRAEVQPVTAPFADDFEVFGEVEDTPVGTFNEPTTEPSNEPTAGTFDEPQTSAGSGAVDVPALVVPPPADVDFEPWDEDYADAAYPDAPAGEPANERPAETPGDQSAPAASAVPPADDLDFLGAYADTSISFTGYQPDGGTAGWDRADNGFATGPGTGPGAGGGRGNTQGTGGAYPQGTPAGDLPGQAEDESEYGRDNGSGAAGFAHGRGPGPGSSYAYRHDHAGSGGPGQQNANPFADLAARHAKGKRSGGQQGGSQGQYPGDPGYTGDSGYPGTPVGPGPGQEAPGAGYISPDEEYMNVDPENDLDISETGEFGVPVVERLLGGVVIEEIRE
jgi:DNA polymerase-3 subunit gamma/tau